MVHTTVGSLRLGPEGGDAECLVEGVADTMRLGQSYSGIGFKEERSIVNRDLAERGE